MNLLARDKANDVAREANIKSYATALSSYAMDKWWYPICSSTTCTWDFFKTGNWSGVMNSAYWMTQNLDKQPAATDFYYYMWLNTGSSDVAVWARHFVICVKLSDESEAWNFTGNMATGVEYTFTWVWAMENSTGNYYCSFM